MGRRIEVELTSTREDGWWTWRAAGARQPKGDVAGDLLYDGAQVGDVVKVEAEFHVDGIEVTEVFAPKKKKERTDILEMKGRPLRDDELVTTQRASRDERRGGGRRRRDRDGGGGGGSRGRDGRSGPRRDRTPPPDNAEQRPKPKRLRPKRVHRDALLADVTDEHRPIVEQLVRDGMPGVRQAIDRQNTEAKEAGKPEIDSAPIIAIAESHLNKARLAEWRDKADAAIEMAEELDLRDLRSVVVAGGDIARDDETRDLAERLKQAYDARVETDHNNWLQDMETAITDGRVVRALRLSSRPVKAGAPLPPELATQLASQASAALAADVGQDRWATVLDALAYSPIRGAVTPEGLPESPKKDLLDAIQRLADRIPTIAEMFGIDPAKTPRSNRRRRGGSGGGKDGRRGGRDQGQDDGGSRSTEGPKSSEGAAGDQAAPEASPTAEPPAGDAPVDDGASAPEAGPTADAGQAATNGASDTTDDTTPASDAPAGEVDTSASDAPTEDADTPADQATDVASVAGVDDGVEVAAAEADQHEADQHEADGASFADETGDDTPAVEVPETPVAEQPEVEDAPGAQPDDAVESTMADGEAEPAEEPVA